MVVITLLKSGKSIKEISLNKYDLKLIKTAVNQLFQNEKLKFIFDVNDVMMCVSSSKKELLQKGSNAMFTKYGNISFEFENYELKLCNKLVDGI